MLSTGAPYWDASGNVGIGTTSPSGNLQVAAANPRVRVTNTSGTQTDLMLGADSGIVWLGNEDNGPLYFITNNAERMRIDASGIVTGTAGNLMLVQRTALTLTTQTAPEFTSIPSWVKRITVMFNNVSTNGANHITIQIGTGGAATISGYVSQTTGISQSVGASITSVVGFLSYSNSASYGWSGIVTISNVSGNVWVASGVLGNPNVNILSSQVSGSVTLSGTLDYLRLISSATGSPSDQFDTGTINIQYE